MLSLSGKVLVICHPERSEGSPGKAKPADLMLSVIFNPQNTTLPGVCSPVEAGEHTRRLEYERQYSRSDLYCGDSTLRSE